MDDQTLILYTQEEDRLSKLLRPPAEVVRTGLPLGSAISPVNPNPQPRLVAGPFNPEPPSKSTVPPNSAAYTPRIPSPTGFSHSVHSASAHVPTAAELDDELAYLSLGKLGPAKGGKKPFKKTILWEVLRSLKLPSRDVDGNVVDQGDLPLLSTSLPAAKQTLTQVRHSHHQLAQMLATGTKQEECALVTGYSPVYISILKTDPTFVDLIAYYSAQREVIFVDAIERMRTLGINTLEELQSRLEEDPSQFTNRELFEQAELTLIKPMAATRSAHPITPSNSGAGVSVNVNFIQNPNKTDSPSQPDIIDLKPEHIRSQN